jgi:hypothetical protein
MHNNMATASILCKINVGYVSYNGALDSLRYVASTERNEVIIIIITTISFMQSIYTYIPETNNVPKEYNVAAILLLLFMVPISLVPVFTL